MRTSVLVTKLTALSSLAITAMLVVSGTATAVGPGGWDHLGVGSRTQFASLDGAVYALSAQPGGVLYAGGRFTAAGGNPKAARIARWNGLSWSALGNTPLGNGAVDAIAVHGGDVYAGGTFVNAGGNPNADFLAKWDGNAWTPFCKPAAGGAAFTGNVQALQIIGNTLYVGGSFQNGAGIATADYLLACDLATGAARSTVEPGGEISGAVYALTADSRGILYAGGGFIDVAQIPAADNIAAFDGAAWHALGSGPGGHAVGSFVRGLTAHGTDIYVGTDSVDVAGIPRADHVARWNGSSWSALGSNSANTNGWFPASSFIYDLETFGTLVIAAGSFQNANGGAANDNIAYFDGQKWHALGSDGAANGPFSGELDSVAVGAGKIYTGGTFTRAGGDNRAQFLADYSVRLPDASIGRTPRGRFTGGHVYSSTGAGESLSVATARARKQTFYVRIQNNGVVTTSFTLRAAGGARGITARYYRSGIDVTRRLVAGTYATTSIAPGSSLLLRVVVSVARSSAAVGRFAIAVKPTAGVPKDVVQAVVRVS